MAHYRYVKCLSKLGKIHRKILKLRYVSHNVMLTIIDTRKGIFSQMQ